MRAQEGSQPGRPLSAGTGGAVKSPASERASVRARRVRIAPASLGPHTPCEAGARVGDKEESQPGRRRPPAPGRVGAAGVGARRAAAPGRGGEGSETLRAAAPAGPGAGGEAAARAAAADAMLGSVGNGALPGGSPAGWRSGWNRLGPAAPVRAAPEPGTLPCGALRMVGR